MKKGLRIGVGGIAALVLAVALTPLLAPMLPMDLWTLIVSISMVLVLDVLTKYVRLPTPRGHTRWQRFTLAVLVGPTVQLFWEPFGLQIATLVAGIAVVLALEVLLPWSVEGGLIRGVSRICLLSVLYFGLTKGFHNQLTSLSTPVVVIVLAVGMWILSAYVLSRVGLTDEHPDRHDPNVGNRFVFHMVVNLVLTGGTYLFLMPDYSQLMVTSFAVSVIVLQVFYPIVTAVIDRTEQAVPVFAA